MKNFYLSSIKTLSKIYTKHCFYLVDQPKNSHPWLPQGIFGIHPIPSTPQGQTLSGPQAAAAAVLDPGGHEKAGEGDRDQAEHNAAEEGFDH